MTLTLDLAEGIPEEVDPPPERVRTGQRRRLV